MLKECPDFSAELLQYGTIHSQSLEGVAFLYLGANCQTKYLRCIGCTISRSGIASFYRVSGADRPDWYLCANPGSCELVFKKEEMICETCKVNDEVIMTRKGFYLKTPPSTG